MCCTTAYLHPSPPSPPSPPSFQQRWQDQTMKAQGMVLPQKSATRSQGHDLSFVRWLENTGFSLGFSQSKGAYIYRWWEPMLPPWAKPPCWMPGFAKFDDWMVIRLSEVWEHKMLILWEFKGHSERESIGIWWWIYRWCFVGVIMMGYFMANQYK